MSADWTSTPRARKQSSYIPSDAANRSDRGSGASVHEKILLPGSVHHLNVYVSSLPTMVDQVVGEAQRQLAQQKTTDLGEAVAEKRYERCQKQNVREEHENEHEWGPKYWRNLLRHVET